MSRTTTVAAAAMVSIISALSAGCSNQSDASGQKDSVQQVASDAMVVQAASAAAPESETPCRGLTALERAANSEKYLFAFLYRGEDEHTQAMREVFRGAMAKVPERAISIEIDATQVSEKPFLQRFRAGRGPSPLVLAIAPSGAVTKGLATDFTEGQLLEAFASPGMESCLAALQDGKVVLVCVQNATTEHNQEALAGVRDFKALSQFADITEIVRVDPNDPAEAGLLQAFKVAPTVAEATTVMLSPPGRAVAKFSGATDKADLEKALLSPASGCKPGSACCPKKK